MKRILILIAVFVILSCKTTNVEEIIEEKKEEITEEKIEVKEEEIVEEKVEEIAEEKIEEKIIEEVAEEQVEEKEEICVVSKDAENRIPRPVTAMWMPSNVPRTSAARNAIPPSRMVAGAFCAISSLTETPDFLNEIPKSPWSRFIRYCPSCSVTGLSRP